MILEIVKKYLSGEALMELKDLNPIERVGGFSEDIDEEQAYINFWQGLNDGRKDVWNYFSDVTPFPNAEKSETTKNHFNRMDSVQRLNAHLNLLMDVFLIEQSKESLNGWILESGIQMESSQEQLETKLKSYNMGKSIGRCFMAIAIRNFLESDGVRSDVVSHSELADVTVEHLLLSIEKLIPLTTRTFTDGEICSMQGVMQMMPVGAAVPTKVL